MRTVLCWQTYYLASHHIESWLECEAAGVECIILLNNEHGVYDKIVSSLCLPKGMRDSLVPIDPNTYSSLRLPLLPYHNKQLSIVNYYNSDYGFYVASSRYSESLRDIYFIKVDHDVMLFGKTWPEFFRLLTLDFSTALTLQLETSVDPNWYWHPSSASVYGENYRYGLFGLQGLPGLLCEELKERRIELFKSSEHYNNHYSCEDLDISTDLNWPICESFFHSELLRLNIPFIELFREYPHLPQAYTLDGHGGLCQVNISNLIKDSQHPFWLFHPWKPVQS
jgi:hypothetical protein